MKFRVFLVNLSQRATYCGLVLLGGLLLYWILHQIFSLFPSVDNPVDWLIEQLEDVNIWLAVAIVGAFLLLAEFGSISYSMYKSWKLPKVTKDGAAYYKETRKILGRRKREPASRPEMLAHANLKIIRDKLKLPETLKTDLFVQKADSLNAYTLGLETPIGGIHAICLHSALLGLSSANVAAVLAHELGHVKNRDTATKLFMSFFRTFVSFVIFAPVYLLYGILWLIAVICLFVPFLRILGVFFHFLLGLLIGGVRILEKLVMWPADLYERQIARRSEFKADAVAAKCVGPTSISRVLFLLSKRRAASEKNSILVLVDQLKILHSTHPPLEDRIQAVQTRAYSG